MTSKGDFKEDFKGALFDSLELDTEVKRLVKIYMLIFRLIILWTQTRKQSMRCMR